MKQKLIILSDLWGKQKSEWLANYIQILEPSFDIVYYDCCELGGIDTSAYTEEKLHTQFVNFGIIAAVKRLTELEKEKVSMLAFSIGGTIAWQFGNKNQNIEKLVCVSSTRLRKETERPTGEIMLYYGSDDRFRPSQEWLESMQLNYYILNDTGHECYRSQVFAAQFCKPLVEI